MEDWTELARKIRVFVNPATFPVGLRFLEGASYIPSSARRPLRDLGVKQAPCQAASMVRRYGWTVAIDKDDQGCAIAAHTYGWEKANEDGVVKFLTQMNYASDEKAAKEVLGGFRLLEPSGDLTVVYSPLEKTKIEPHVILLYVNPAQLMRLLHGATFENGKPVQSSFSGRAASCTEGAVGAYQDDAVKVVVPGNGDRVWAGCQDYEMLMAIPASRLAGLVEGLEKTHHKGIRYPIPTYMRFEPEVGFSVPLSDIFKPEGLTGLKKK